jgi:flagellar L-ring protein precursor FlgH
MSHAMTIRTLALCCALALSAGAQSLWNPDRPSPSLFADTTARSVGDVLTIVISEKQVVKNKEDTELGKTSTLDAALTNFDVLPDAFEPLPAVAGSSDRQFDAEAKYDKENQFETRLSVIVIDVQPNGNLVVEGRRRVIMDKESKCMRVTGIVRPYDVTNANSVYSWQVANASVAYEGNGPLTRTTNRGFLGELLDLIWPF